MKSVHILMSSLCLASRLCFALSNVLGESPADTFDLRAANYFITGFGSSDAGYRGEVLVKPRNQAKFRINANFRLAGWEDTQSGAYLGYTQTSFWNVYDPDAPFFDNNYRPEAFVYYDGAAGPRGRWYRPSAHLSLVHESNGLTGQNNRGWDRVAVGAKLGPAPRSRIAAGVSLWRAFSQTHDFRNSLGDGELHLSWRLPGPAGALRLGASAASRFAFRDHFFTNLEVNLFLNPFTDPRTRLSWAPAFMIQYFTGKGETMREHARHSASLRLGLAFVR
jgi:outer membrane phospholipase A